MSVVIESGYKVTYLYQRFLSEEISINQTKFKLCISFDKKRSVMVVIHVSV